MSSCILKSCSGLIKIPETKPTRDRGWKHVSLQKIIAWLSLPKRLFPHNLQAVIAIVTDILKMPFSFVKAVYGAPESSMDFELITKWGACSSPATWILPAQHWAQTSSPVLDSLTLTSAEKLMSGLSCALYMCRQSCTQLTRTSQDDLSNPQYL